jgi:hypothetical protein
VSVVTGLKHFRRRSTLSCMRSLVLSSYSCSPQLLHRHCCRTARIEIIDSFSTIRRKSVLTALFLGLVFALIGCSSSTERAKQQGVIGPDVAPGLLLVEVRGIDLSESGQPKIYYQYEVQPATGRSAKLRKKDFKTTFPPTDQPAR